MAINYEEIGERIGKLVAEKQLAYGNSYGKSGDVLRLLFPDGVKPDQYQELLAICRVIDKLFRLATDPGYGGESPWGDICGYSLLRLGSWELNNNIQEKSKPQRIDETSHDIPGLTSAKTIGPVDICSYSVGIKDAGLGHLYE